jgi:O-antigen ligase
MLKKIIDPVNIMGISYCLIAIGLPCDGFLRGFQNAGLIGLLLSGVINFTKRDRREVYRNISIALFFLFAFCILGYAFTDDMAELNRKTGLKILLVLYPMAFAMLPALTHRIKKISMSCFIVSTAIIAVLTDIDYLMHFREYNILISQSKPIEIIGGTMHIYFSVLMAFSIFLGLHLLRKEGTGTVVLNNFSDWIILSAIVLNFISLHLLSARTGLMAFYFALLLVLIRFVIRTKRYTVLAGGLSLMVLTPLMAYMLVPSVKHRVNNTWEDVHRYFTGQYVGYFSISERFETWKVAIHIFGEHPVFGVGEGDLNRHIEAGYRINDTRLMRNEYLPNCHNQYIETMAAHGLPGIIVFVALLWLLWKKVKTLPRNNYLWLCFCAITTASFLVESLLERQLGLAFFLFFLFFILKDAYDPVRKTVVAP